MTIIDIGHLHYILHSSYDEVRRISQGLELAWSPSIFVQRCHATREGEQVHNVLHGLDSITVVGTVGVESLAVVKRRKHSPIKGQKRVEWMQDLSIEQLLTTMVCVMVAAGTRLGCICKLLVG